MEENVCKGCMYKQAERAVSRKAKAFDTALQKVGGLAALAECVADTVEVVGCSGGRDSKQLSKLTELAYLLSESMVGRIWHHVPQNK